MQIVTWHLWVSLTLPRALMERQNVLEITVLPEEVLSWFNSINLLMWYSSYSLLTGCMEKHSRWTQIFPSARGCVPKHVKYERLQLCHEAICIVNAFILPVVIWPSWLKTFKGHKVHVQFIGLPPFGWSSPRTAAIHLNQLPTSWSDKLLVWSHFPSQI